MTFCAPTMSQARLIYSCALEHSTGVSQAIIHVSSRCDTEDHAQPASDYKVLSPCPSTWPAVHRCCPPAKGCCHL